ncbi:MAG: efflux RND transporter periplasmic adaptor subunit [Deltaproteobacteria bacterium]|nr:efflux RND transporter periplasmic adaptor subunit [Deltaproteobacteria bacterium]
MSKTIAKANQSRRLITKLAVLAILLAVLAWGTMKAFFPKVSQVSYLTETVRRGDIIRTVVTIGEVASAQLVNVGAQVSGKVEVLHVQPGSKVSQGDLIAEIDSTTQRNNLAAEQARLRTNEAQLLSRTIALKTAQSKYDREINLKKADATSTENLEAAEQALAAAKASLAETNSNILQSQTAVSTAQINLAYTRITSPLDGTVVSVPVKQGQTVNANQSTPTIAQIADLSLMEIRMQISEGDVTKVGPGLRVTYTILSEPDRVFSGVLESVDPGLTSVSDGSYNGSLDSGTAVYFYGKLKTENPNGTLRIGMTTQNTIVIGEARNVLMVPTVALTSLTPRSPQDSPDRSGVPRRGQGAQSWGNQNPNRSSGGPGGRRQFSDSRTSQSPDGPPVQAGPTAQMNTLETPQPPRVETNSDSSSNNSPSPAASNLRSAQGKILVMENGTPVERTVLLGLSDNMYTEVLEGLNEGEEVVSAQMTLTEMETRASQQQTGGGRARVGLPRL